MFIYTNTNVFFGADHEQQQQLRYGDSVLAQGTLIQVQQGLENMWPQLAHKNLLEFGTEVTELLVETENFEQRERIGRGCWCMLATS